MAAAKRKAAAQSFTLAQVEAIAAAAVAKALASQTLAPIAAPVRHGFRPCDPVLIREDAELTAEQAKYARSAGVIERVDENGALVDMDLDHKRVSFPAAALKLLKA